MAEIPMPPLPDRESFNIGEASRIAQVPAHTLRYWESRLGCLRPARRGSGHRRYSRRDLETILRVKDLVSNRGFTLGGVRRLLGRERRSGAGPEDAARGEASAGATRLLREVRSELRQILADLAR